MTYRIGARVFLTTVRRPGTVVGRATNGTWIAYRVALDDGERVIAAGNALLPSIAPRQQNLSPCDVEHSA